MPKTLEKNLKEVTSRYITMIYQSYGVYIDDT